MDSHKEKLKIKLLSRKDIHEMSYLSKELNPLLSEETIRNYLEQMFDIPSYNGFGLFRDRTLIGLASGWITVRLYSGKQLEIDNVIISRKVQSKGYGRYFLNLIEDWAQQNHCKTVELNTYVENARSHKFYFNLDYSILGFHFQKKI